MALQLPIGISDFREVIEEGCYFVDKTLWIKEVITDKSKVMLFTRPRRFGKTLNLSMLYYFLTNKLEEISPALFKNTFIAKEKAVCEKYQNQHPVIFITLKDVKKSNFRQAYAAIEKTLSDLYKRHRYLLDSDEIYPDEKNKISALIEERAKESHLEESLKALSNYIERVSKKKPYILIDEYDTPITAGYINHFYEEIINLTRNLLGEALKDNTSLAKGVITGITRISQESIFSGVNNPEVYSLLREQCGEYFGFTEDEVIKILEDDQHPEQLDEMKHWYNGYQVGKHTLYNPWSIINCIKQGYIFRPYWLNTSDNALIKQQLESGKESVKESFVNLLQGNRIDRAITESLVFPDLKDSEESIWSLLHASGYVNVHTQEQVGRRLITGISIPNNEVKYVYDGIVEGWFSKSLSLNTYDNFSKTLMNGDITGFKEILSSYLMQSSSYFDFNENSPEQVFHTFILGLVVGMRDEYIITSNQESGFGRYDVAMIPRDNSQKGLLLEFKVAKTSADLRTKAKEALAQINSNKYTAIFRNHNVGSILLLGLSFCGKDVEVLSEWG